MRSVETIRVCSEWLAHCRWCGLCPANYDLCDRGVELAAAVRESMVSGESWGVLLRERERP